MTPVPTLAPHASSAPARRRIAPVLIGATIVIAAVAGALWLRPESNTGTAMTATPTPPAFDPALVLLVAPTPADPSLANTASLATDALSRVLSTMRYAQVTVSSSATNASDADRRAEAAAGRMATILDGRLNTTGDSLQLDLRLTDAATGRLVLALPAIRVSRADPARGLDAALEPVMSAVAIVTNPLLGPATLPNGPLPAIKAVRALEQAMLQTEFARQIEGMDLAIDADSSWTLSRVIRAARYFSWSQYYEEERVRREIVASLPGPTVQLSPYETALREAALAANDAAPEREAVALKRLALIAPGAYGSTRYIGALQDLNRPREALEQLERMGPFTRDPTAPAGSQLVETGGYWGNVADLRHYIGDHAGERAAAERSEQVGGANVFTLMRRGVAYAALGDSIAVERLVDAAYVVSSDAFPNAFGGEVILIVAQELMAHGHEAHGRQVLDRALRWLAEHRNEARRGDTIPRTDIAFREVLALRVAGRNAEALEAVKPLVALNSTDSRFLSFYGRVQGALGNDAAADSVDAWLAELQRDPAKAGTSLNERAFLAAARGRREEAVALLRESFARGTAFYIRRNLHRFNDWFPFRGYEPYERMVTPAG